MRVPLALHRKPGFAAVPRKSPPVDKKNGHVVDLAAFAGPPRDPPKKKSLGPHSFSRQHVAARSAAQACIDAKDWRLASDAAVLGLYSLLHLRVYGVLPAELDGPDYRAALSRAKFVCTQLTPQGAYSLVRWTWKRAESQEQSRKDDADNGFRIGWRYQFSASMITNFKVAQARAGKKL